MRVVLHTVLIVVCLKMAGQQLPMYNHYFYKPLFYNPAYAGKNNNTEAMLLNRSQWTDFNGAPQFNLLSLDGSIKEKKAALALTIINDKRGISKRIGGSVGYAYRLNFNEETYLQLGLSAGAINNSIDYSRAVSESSSDPALFFSNQQKTALDFNAGFLFGWKGLELAASVPQLVGNKINYQDNNSVGTWYRQERHYIASVKYEITISDEKQLFIAPQAVTRIVPGTPLQYDAGVNFQWKNYCWLGAMYKSGYAVAANAGVTLNKSFDIGYSYEFITSSIGKYSGTSHEIMVNYKFGKSKKTEEIPLKNDGPDYTHQFDSLHHELEVSNDKIKENEKEIAELTKKLEALKAAQQAQTQNNTPATTNSVNTTTQNNNQTTGNNVTEARSLNTSPTNNNNVSASPKNTDQNTNATLNPSNNGLSESSSSKEMEDNIWIITSKASECKTPAGSVPAKGYYVIAGTFFYQDFAMNEVKRLKNQGFSAASWMYSNSKQFNYVYIQKLNDKKSAIVAAKKYQQQGIKDAWVKILD